MRADVADLECESVAEIPLHVGRILHHDGGVAIGIKQCQRAADAGEVAERVSCRRDEAIGEWIAQACRSTGTGAVEDAATRLLVCVYPGA